MIAAVHDFTVLGAAELGPCILCAIVGTDGTLVCAAWSRHFLYRSCTIVRAFLSFGRVVSISHITLSSLLLLS